MRETKFRAWDNDHQTFIYLDLGNVEDAMFGRHGIVENTILKPWQQYTDLKDKDGKEIYEGDILKVGDFIFEVKYRYNKVRFMLWEIKFSRYVSITPVYRHPQRYEIIGNKYENPKLLK